MLTDSSPQISNSGTLKRRIERIFALLWIVVGAIVIVEARKLDYLSEYGPGPGFLPLWVGTAVILLGLFLMARLHFDHKKAKDFSLPGRNAALQMVFVMAGFFGFVFLADKAGFLLSIGLLFFFLLGFVERRGWKFSLAASITAVFLFWVIFELGLKMQLPLSIFDFLP